MSKILGRGLLIVSVFLLGCFFALDWSGDVTAAPTVTVLKSYGSLRSVSGAYWYFEDGAGTIHVLKEKDGVLKDWVTVVRK